MKTMSLRLALLILLAGICYSAPRTYSASAASTGSPVIGLVSYGTSTYQGGCGCAYTATNSTAPLQYTLLSNVNFDRPQRRRAWIQVDGSIQSLYFVSEIAKTTTGDHRFVEVFKSTEVAITIDTVKVKEGYEGDSRVGSIRVLKAGKTRQIIVKGGCGC